MRRRRRTLAGLLGVALIAAMGANGSARAQTSGGPTDLASQFGGYALDADSEGMSFTYDSPGLIPGTPSPLAQVSFPESLVNMNKSPSGYALASLVYPGPLLADLPTVLALGGFDQQTEPLGPDRPMTGDIPAYPVRAEAFYPGGPTSKAQDVGSGRETVNTAADSANATALYGAATLPPLFTTGSATSTTETHLEQGLAVSRTRVELSGVDLFASLIHIESIVTDLVSTSDGTTAATDGTTIVSGVTFLGLPATLDGSGIHLAPQAAVPGAPATLPPLGGITDPLQPVLTQVNDLIVSTVGTANAGINELLNAGGITVQLIQPTEVKNGADASRLASGVLVTIRYTGDSEPVFGEILKLIDPTKVPADYVDPCTTFQQPAPCPIPFSSPQTLVLAMKTTHVETIGLAAGHVHTGASQPFALPSIGSVGGISTPGATAGFSTPTPALGGGGGGGSGGGSPSIGSATPLGFVGGSPLAAAVSIMLLVLASSAFWFGSGRLADNVLSVASSSCPEGLDRA
ncbi:MAG: hypothetical protein QOI95_3995 [Acidimicrobiaceae bacterium]